MRSNSALTLVRDTSHAYGENSADQRFAKLHERGIRCAEAFRRSQSDLIDVLCELDRSRTFEHFGCTSLYNYCLKYHRLSEDVTCNLIAIVRKSVSVPELKIAIRDGSINFSQARKIAPVINESNKETWLELAKTSSCRELEKAIATEHPKLATVETLKYKTADRLELVLGVSEEFAELLRRIKDLASQRTGCSVSSEDALLASMQVYLEKFDPVKKATRAASRAEAAREAQQNPSQAPGDSNSKSYDSNHTSGDSIDGSADRRNPEASRSDIRNRKPQPVADQNDNVLPVTWQVVARRIPAAVKHQVQIRDMGQCTHRDADGNRCGQRRWLDVHHVKPISQGGSNNLENLTTLCGAHHRQQHL